VLTEYRAHFPQLDWFLDFVLHARFATDRRKAFLWLKALSSWGKGFLTQGVLGHDGLGIVCELSTREVEAALEGKPVGVSVEMIRRAWVVLVDEFRSAKGELKQLNNTFTAAPKNQLRFSVPIFAKVFTSAEGVDSLAGAEGVEGQFAERFSLLDLSSGQRLDDLPVYQQVGKLAYRQVLVEYVAEWLNQGIQRMRALGRDAAGQAADEWLTASHTAHGLDNTYTRLEDNIAGWAEEVRRAIQDYATHTVGLQVLRHVEQMPSALKSAMAANVRTVRASRHRHDEPQLMAVVRRPGAVVKAWIQSSMQVSQAVMVGHKATAIVHHLAGEDISKVVRWYEIDEASGEAVECRAKAAMIPLDGAAVVAGSNVIPVDFRG
jgi:hypothetical protein